MASHRKGTKTDSDTEQQPWYAEGLRFECQADCGACCTNHDDYAYVYLKKTDVRAMAAELELTVDVFCERYTETDEEWTILRMDQPDCPFLEGNRCQVYGARPVQCRTFPFWSESVRSPRAWRRLASFCPGIDQGEHHSLPVIQGHLADREGDG